MSESFESAHRYEDVFLIEFFCRNITASFTKWELKQKIHSKH